MKTRTTCRAELGVQQLPFPFDQDLVTLSLADGLG